MVKKIVFFELDTQSTILEFWIKIRRKNITALVREYIFTFIFENTHMTNQTRAYKIEVIAGIRKWRHVLLNSAKFVSSMWLPDFSEVKNLFIWLKFCRELGNSILRPISEKKYPYRIRLGASSLRKSFHINIVELYEYP